MGFPNANFVTLSATATPDPGGDGSRRMFFREKEFLKTNGWTVTASGDGLSAFSSSGDVITGDALGANGVNDLAWYAAVNGDGNSIMRQIVSQTATNAVTASLYNLRYSSSDGFSVGGSATVPSTATDGGAVATNLAAGPPNSSGLLHQHFGYAETVSPYRFMFAIVEDNGANNDCIFGWGRDLWRTTTFAADDAPDRSIMFTGGTLPFSDGVGGWVLAGYIDTGAPATSANYQLFDVDPANPPGLGTITWDGTSLSSIELQLKIRTGTDRPIPPLRTVLFRGRNDGTDQSRLLEDPVEFGGTPGVFGDHVALNNAIFPWDPSETIWTVATGVSELRHYMGATAGACEVAVVVPGAVSGDPEDIAGGFSI